jgi:hypothetical protein
MSEVSETPVIETEANPEPVEQVVSEQPTQAQQKALEKLEREFDIKVNGKESKVKIDLNDTARLQRALQLEAAANSAFQERAITAKQLQEIQSDVNEFLEQFNKDPMSIIMNPEFNFSKEQKRQLAEAILKEDLEESQKTPEQIEYEETKRRYEALLQEKQALEDERRASEQKRLEDEAAIEITNEISKAIEAGQLPKSTYINKKLADLAYIAYNNGVDLSMQDLIPFVKQHYKKDMGEMLGLMSDEEVESLMGSERIRTIRNKQIQAVRPKEGAPKSPLKTEDTGASSKKQEEAKKLKAKDFFNSLKG